MTTLRRAAADETNTKIGQIIKQFFSQARREQLTHLLNVCERMYGFFVNAGLDLLLVDETPVYQLSRMSKKDFETYTGALVAERNTYFGCRNFLRFYGVFMEKLLPNTEEVREFNRSFRLTMEQNDEDNETSLTVQSGTGS